MSNAQSGLLNVIDERAPGEGAVPSVFHSSVPARRIDRSTRATGVPLTSTKFEAPGPAWAGTAVSASSAAIAIFLMARNIILRANRLKMACDESLRRR
jgi:hypothetical protein